MGNDSAESKNIWTITINESDESQSKQIENQYCQINYCLITAHEEGVQLHPQEQMELLGYKVLQGVPQSIADSWWFTVEKFIEPFPKYLRKINYDFDYWSK